MKFHRIQIANLTKEKHKLKAFITYARKNSETATATATKFNEFHYIAVSFSYTDDFVESMAQTRVLYIAEAVVVTHVCLGCWNNSKYTTTENNCMKVYACVSVYVCMLSFQLIYTF